MTTNNTTPKRGEIWDINLDPTIGQEIQKRRPAVVISSDAVGKLRVKLVVPITGWSASFVDNIWHVRLVPNQVNGLAKESAADALQTRCVAFERFVSRRGRVAKSELEEIVQALGAVVELA
jgi:mRNA interferase MazF